MEQKKSVLVWSQANTLEDYMDSKKKQLEAIANAPVTEAGEQATYQKLLAIRKHLDAIDDLIVEINAIE